MELHKNIGVEVISTYEFIIKINNEMYWFVRLVEEENGSDSDFWYYDINTDKIGEKVSDEDYETYYDDDKFDEVFEEYKSNI